MPRQPHWVAVGRYTHDVTDWRKLKKKSDGFYYAFDSQEKKLRKEQMVAFVERNPTNYRGWEAFQGWDEWSNGKSGGSSGSGRKGPTLTKGHPKKQRVKYSEPDSESDEVIAEILNERQINLMSNAIRTISLTTLKDILKRGFKDMRHGSCVSSVRKETFPSTAVP